MKSGSITAPKGFTASGVACGIKSDAMDLALIVSDRVASVAGVFTSNKVCGAPVTLSRQNIADGKAQAIVISSGNSNTCTGDAGASDALEMAHATATGLGIKTQDVIVASTGVIGRPLPMDLINAGIAKAAKCHGVNGASDAAVAIMTTDTKPKESTRRVMLSKGEITIGGICKGSGMVAPRLATMLAFITTDAAVAPALLKKALTNAVEPSFNSVTIDGDTSTSDMVIILANGAAMAEEIVQDSDDWNLFCAGLADLCIELAKMIAKDGEGATKFITVRVEDALSVEDARKVARAVAQSPLVKTAIFGGDPNWGRIACAVGYSEADFNPGNLSIQLDSLKVFDKGLPTTFDLAAAEKIVSQRVIDIIISLGAGTKSAEMYTCDYSYDYIKINAEYTT